MAAKLVGQCVALKGLVVLAMGFLQLEARLKRPAKFNAFDALERR